MPKFTLLEFIQKDIEEIKNLFEYEKHKLTKIQTSRLARGIILNLEDHLEEFIKLNNRKKKLIRKLKNHLCKS
jgi:hypothetical protein